MVFQVVAVLFGTSDGPSALGDARNMWVHAESLRTIATVGSMLPTMRQHLLHNREHSGMPYATQPILLEDSAVHRTVLYGGVVGFFSNVIVISVGTVSGFEPDSMERRFGSDASWTLLGLGLVVSLLGAVFHSQIRPVRADLLSVDVTRLVCILVGRLLFYAVVMCILTGMLQSTWALIAVTVVSGAVEGVGILRQESHPDEDHSHYDFQYDYFCKCP